MAVTRVRVVGEQFAWNVHYPGPDGLFGPTAIERIEAAMNPLGLDYDDPSARDDLVLVNQLHVPVDRAVEVVLSSKDVIHSFYLPFMRVKQDAIPGQTVRLHFTPTVTGRSEIACAELCGLGHARMRGFLVVQSAEEYESWYQEELEYQ
jgi:cytochrome c oxidase subunit 2